MLRHTESRMRRIVLIGLMSLSFVASKAAFGSDSFVAVAASLPCASLSHEALGMMQGAVGRGEAFGIPKDDWTNDVADAFRLRLDTCDGAAAKLDWSLRQHFDYIWADLGPDLLAQRTPAVQPAQSATLSLTDADKRALEAKAAERIRLRAEDEAAKAVEEEQQKKEAAARLNNSACVKADEIRQTINRRSGGDIANVLGVILMANQNGDTKSGCKLADALYEDLDKLKSVLVDCSSAEAAQIGGVKQSLYAMRKEMSCLGWFE
ncbi:hypothetical protein EN746_05255 [Mesorhizobium sp. M8A.F.Ca.ET.023.02.2.1]|nr:hypothetical protein EN746_05255 [Mesorhizobium sp. M8A.F.Ca.ET.023.02.2.1]